eukprot:TRINITY_DN90037_c0_g1_i1.p1 TRINITY_DN90037_c0_g1~~TRINITY_DN90037_c0_g1_i1.p1  ORF type:complete len:493 (-),score=73.50 TRINITY_DN90037_c0_g1_i1:112-1590(-)
MRQHLNRFDHRLRAVHPICFCCSVMACLSVFDLHMPTGTTSNAPAITTLVPARANLRSGMLTKNRARICSVLGAVSNDAAMNAKIQAAHERISEAKRCLALLQDELVGRNLFSAPIDQEFVAEVLALFTPKSAAPMRPLLDKVLDQMVPALNDKDSLAALVTGLAIARLPHEPAWLAAGDATIRLCKAGCVPADVVVKLAWSFATAGEKRPDLFLEMKRASMPHLRSLSEENLKLFAWACAEVGEHFSELGEPPVSANQEATGNMYAALQSIMKQAATDEESGSEVLLADPLPIIAMHDVLSEADASELLRIADEDGLWAPSSRRGARDVMGADAERTSWSALLSGQKNREHPVVKSIRAWAASTLHVPIEFVEALQLVRYSRGERYSSHVDWGRAQDASLWLAGQRTATALIYLNTLPEQCGGETVFGSLGVRVQPRAGTAVIWPNVDIDGKPQPLVEHEAMPVLCDATKYAVNVWVRCQKMPQYGFIAGT